MLFGRNPNKNQTEEAKVLSNPKILEVNLIKEEERLEFDWKKGTKALLLALGVTIFIIVELYLGLDWWQKDEEARLELTQAETSKVSKEVAEFRKSAADALAYQDKTLEVDRLLGEHIYWTNFFKWLESNTLSTVSFSSFSGTNDGEYTLAGKAGSFAEVSWQIQQFANDPLVLNVESMTVSSGEERTREDIASQIAAAEQAAANQDSESEEVFVPAEPAGVTFNLALEIDPTIFNK